MYQFSDIEDDFFLDSNSRSQDFWNDDFDCEQIEPIRSSKGKKPLREKNVSGRNGYKHIPHKEKPPQVVAKRNARERRRVQAVNNAFVKLRNVVPIQNSRGKRISKVKTLLYAIDYIRALDNILQDCGKYSSYEMEDYGTHKYLNSNLQGTCCCGMESFSL